MTASDCAAKASLSSQSLMASTPSWARASGHRTYAHDSRINAGIGGGDPPAEGHTSEAAGLLGGHEDQRGGAVVQRAAVTGRDRAALAERWLELRERLEGGIGAGAFVLPNDEGLALLLREAKLHALGGERGVGLGGDGVAVAPQGEGVLV